MTGADPGPGDFEDRLAQALRENEELKQALRELKSSAADAQAAADEMELLIYAIGHDFRTSLRTMGSYAQLLERQYALDQDSREMTSFILKGADEMKTLVEDILKYSRINTSPERRVMPLYPVAHWAALNVQEMVRESGAQIAFGENLPEIAINESQFVQLFEQLFANALKFRSADPPRIEVTADEGTDAYLISVGDNGIGIDPKYHDVVFAPSKRLHGKEIPGTGFGLAICRKIARAHGGKIWVESDGSHGSTFRVSLPF